MGRSVAQPAAAEGPHLLLYDGVCGLCDGLVARVLKADRRGIFYFASLQSRAGHAALAPFGADADDLTTMYVVENYRTAAPVPLERGRAALFVLSSLGWPWKAATVLRVLPRPVLDRLYDLVARHRYQLFGRHERCLLPLPAYRSRFLEEDPRSEP